MEVMKRQRVIHTFAFTLTKTFAFVWHLYTIRFLDKKDKTKRYFKSLVSLVIYSEYLFED